MELKMCGTADIHCQVGQVSQRCSGSHAHITYIFRSAANHTKT